MLSEKKCVARRALATSLRSPVTHIHEPKYNGTFLGDLLFASGRALSSSFLLEPPLLSLQLCRSTARVERDRVYTQRTLAAV